jgi:hypothetical protein
LPTSLLTSDPAIRDDPIGALLRVFAGDILASHEGRSTGVLVPAPLPALDRDPRQP